MFFFLYWCVVSHLLLDEMNERKEKLCKTNIWTTKGTKWIWYTLVKKKIYNHVAKQFVTLFITFCVCVSSYIYLLIFVLCNYIIFNILIDSLNLFIFCILFFFHKDLNLFEWLYFINLLWIEQWRKYKSLFTS